MNDVLVAKKADLERCVQQVRLYELLPGPLPLEKDPLRQDAILLNVQRACELAIDMSNYLVKQKKLGVPAAGRDSFALLAREGIISDEMFEKMAKMIGFRNVLVHRYQELDLEILMSVLEHGLDNLIEFSQIALLAGE